MAPDLRKRKIRGRFHCSKQVRSRRDSAARHARDGEDPALDPESLREDPPQCDRTATGGLNAASSAAFAALAKSPGIEEMARKMSEQLVSSAAMK